MNTFQRVQTWLITAIRDHWMPLLILLVPINIVVWQSDADNAIPFIILPIVAIGVGYLFRPRHIWFVWLASVMLLWIVIGVWGKYGGDDSGESVASVMIEAFAWMFLGVLIPVWLGRRIRTELDDRRHPVRAD